MSDRKVEYIRDLAAHFVSGRVDPSRFGEQDDEEIIAELIDIRGIGRWTAEMFLMFNLLRPNVLPLDDLGLLKAVSVHYLGGEPVLGREGRVRVEQVAQVGRHGAALRPGIYGVVLIRFQSRIKKMRKRHGKDDVPGF